MHPPLIEQTKMLIGRVPAATATMIGRGLFEWRDGGLQPDTRRGLGELFVALYTVRTMTLTCRQMRINA